MTSNTYERVATFKQTRITGGNVYEIRESLDEHVLGDSTWRIEDGDFGDAVQDADHLLAENRKVGRRERFAVASIDIEWDSDEVGS